MPRKHNDQLLNEKDVKGVQTAAHFPRLGKKLSLRSQAPLYCRSVSQVLAMAMGA